MELDRFGTANDLKELLSIRDSIDDLMERRVENEGILPKAELRDEGDAYRVTFEVPGLRQEDLELAVQGRELVIAGQREPDHAGERVFSELNVGPFQRTLTLPSAVNGAAATARLTAGLLILHLPKDDDA